MSHEYLSPKESDLLHPDEFRVASDYGRIALERGCFVVDEWAVNGAVPGEVYAIHCMADGGPLSPMVREYRRRDRRDVTHIAASALERREPSMNESNQKACHNAQHYHLAVRCCL